MISEKHDTNIVTHWLRKWLKSGAQCPPEVISDYSSALLNAFSLAFEVTDLSTYVNRYFAFLQGNHRLSKPNCCIRIDITHLIKLNQGWKSFGKKNTLEKEFFLRFLGLFANCTSFEKFESLLRDILTVALAQTEDITSPSRCFDAQKKLIEEIKTGGNTDDWVPKSKKSETRKNKNNTEFEGSPADDVDPYDADSDDPEIEGRISDFLTNLEKECKVDSKSGTRKNRYWCPSFAKNLLRISKHIPLWTTILASKLDVATSARSEEYFSQQKGLVLNDTRNVQVDKFLVIRIRTNNQGK